MYNYYNNSLEKKEDAKNNSLSLAFLSTNFKLSFDNDLQNISQDEPELDSKEFLNFLFLDELNNKNLSFISPKSIDIKEEKNESEEKEDKKEYEEKEVKNEFEEKAQKIIKNNIKIDKNENVVKFVIKKKNNSIFNIEKNIRLGRLKKNSSKIGKHNKFNTDNIIRRFKVQLTNSIYNYLNDSFEINLNRRPDKRVKVIKKISANLIKSIRKENNMAWLDSKIGDFFSNVISKRFVTYDDRYNKVMINKIYKKGKEKRAIEILNKTVRDFWKIYINEDEYINYNGFNNIYNDIKQFKEKGETAEYIDMYEYIAKHFEDIFNQIKARKRVKLHNSKPRIKK